MNGFGAMTGFDPAPFWPGVRAVAEASGGDSSSPGVQRPTGEDGGREAIRVLVVDDEEDVRLLLSAHLSAAGYEVRCAADGVEALHVLSTSRPDVIFLDVMMPGLDGFAVLKAMRALPAHARTPVIVETAVNLDADEERWFRDHGAVVFRKHRLFGDELMGALKRVLEPGSS